MELSEKPANPATLDAQGLALLAQLSEPQLVYPTDLGAQWLGEPIALPTDFYRSEPSPSGFSILGWRLTETGIAAWKVQAADHEGGLPDTE